MGVSSCIFKGVHPGRLTWNLQITHLERKMIFQTSMIMFHVNLPGCIFKGVSMGCGCGATSREHLSFHLVAMAHPSLVNFHFQKAPTHCYSETQIMDRLLEMSECLDRTLCATPLGDCWGNPVQTTFASVSHQLPWSSSPSTQVSPLRPWSLGGVVLLENFQVESWIWAYTIHHHTPYTPRPFTGEAIVTCWNPQWFDHHPLSWYLTWLPGSL